MSSSEEIVPAAVRRKKRPSDSQKERLIDYLELNLDVAKNQFTSNDGRKDLREKWNHICGILNGMGGAFKTPEQWKKFWSDWKLAVKKRYTAEKRRFGQSGFNGDVIERFDVIEQKVVNIITIEAIEGDGSTEHGLPSPSCSTASNARSSSRESSQSLTPQSLQTSTATATASGSQNQESNPELHVITPHSRRQNKRSREEEETEILKAILDIKKKKLDILSKEDERKTQDQEYRREEHNLKMELMRAQIRKLNDN